MPSAGKTVSQTCRVIGLIGIMNESFVYSFKKAVEIVEDEWGNRNTEQTSIDTLKEEESNISWFSNPELQGNPANLGHIGVDQLILEGKSTFLKNMFVSPRELTASNIKINEIGNFYAKIVDRLENSGKLSKIKIAPLIEKYLWAGCLTCKNELSSWEISSLSYKKTIADAVNIKSRRLILGNCPQCTSSDYIIIWSGEDSQFKQNWLLKTKVNKNK